MTLSGPKNQLILLRIAIRIILHGILFKRRTCDILLKTEEYNRHSIVVISDSRREYD